VRSACNLLGRAGGCSSSLGGGGEHQAAQQFRPASSGAVASASARSWAANNSSGSGNASAGRRARLPGAVGDDRRETIPARADRLQVGSPTYSIGATRRAVVWTRKASPVRVSRRSYQQQAPAAEQILAAVKARSTGQWTGGGGQLAQADLAAECRFQAVHPARGNDGQARPIPLPNTRSRLARLR
jgi:hypothetical protein